MVHNLGVHTDADADADVVIHILKQLSAYAFLLTTSVCVDSGCGGQLISACMYAPSAYAYYQQKSHQKTLNIFSLDCISSN